MVGRYKKIIVDPKAEGFRADALQRRAANPKKSIWLTASAGSGKTKVLTDRVLTLLLEGTSPEHILCLTFTKAAAAEMANRVNERLAEWATMSAPTLFEILGQVLDRVPKSREVKRAQCLFAQVLDLPGGLNIQTIHSFCQSLIARFPFESGIPPHFEIMEEQRSAVELRRRARDNILAAVDSDVVMNQCLLHLTQHVQEKKFDDLISEVIKNRGRLAHGILEKGGVQNAIDHIYKFLGVKKVETVELIQAEALEKVDDDKLTRGVEAFLKGTKTDKKNGQTLSSWLSDSNEKRAANFDKYLEIFIRVKAGTVRSKILTKTAQKTDPGLEEILQSEAERLLIVRERIAAVVTATCTASLLRISAALLEEYDRLKRRLVRLDYNDLIYVARALLTRAGIAPWVLFKLDGGIDHILIDEAQDTNSVQWQIVEALAEEFFSGEGASTEVRTLFAVGDIKQSIFGFQGAEPEQFGKYRDNFATRAYEAQREWEDIDLSVSFRSVDAVLAAVDSVFSRDVARMGVVEGVKPLTHEAFRRGDAGLVELWPPLGPEPTNPIPAWSPPLERVSEENPSRRLAKAVAAKISTLIGSETLLSRGRAIRAGDFMILLRTRGGFMEEIVAELKAREVPVAGVDRVKLGEQLAVMDLIALGRFLLLPDDDLNLAVILKSPLIGIEEYDLYGLAHNRGSDSLWESLSKCGGRSELLRMVADWLTSLLARADLERPYELFGSLLSAEVPAGGSGREAMLRRLGPECEDPIDEFLNHAISYEQDHSPSLEGFLHWMDAGEVETKRDLEQGSVDEVRVMTAHGAKGLQAPIVILPDTISKPQKTDDILWCGSLPLWSPERSLEPLKSRHLRNAWREARDREQRRLLYVAMTRAEDRLYICGYNSTGNKLADDCWYSLIRDGLSDLGEAVEFDFSAEAVDGWHGKGLRIQTEQRSDVKIADIAIGNDELMALPSWIQREPPKEVIPQKPIVPSRLDEDPPASSPLITESGDRFQRGTLVHRMLQFLPNVHPKDRANATERFLLRKCFGLTQHERIDIAGTVIGILEDPQFAKLFSSQSKAEVPLIGTVDMKIGTQIISGQVDRLVVCDDEVLAVDYKTLRLPPKAEENIPVAYVRQMAAYRALLQGIWAGRSVRCALLWTEEPCLMWLNDEQLDSFIAGP